MDSIQTTIELFKEEMKFSAGHFTIFSATERERLHGHNFTVYCALTGPVGPNGMLANYGDFKKRLFALCRRFNEYFLLPGESPHLRVVQEGEHVYAHFAGEVIPFLAKDVMILPIRNVTLEEMARHFVSEIVNNKDIFDEEEITAVTVKISSGPGQFAASRWELA